MISSALCLLCECDDEYLLHMVTACKKLEEIRAKYVAFLENTVSSENTSLWEDIKNDNSKMLQIWLDFSHPIFNFTFPFQTVTNKEEISRNVNYLFAVHKERSILLAATSRKAGSGRRQKTGVTVN